MFYSRVLQQLFFVHTLTRGCVSCVPLWVSLTLCVILCVVPGGATTVAVEASFNDSRCDGGMVCQNDPLLYTCTVKNSQADEAVVHLPSGQTVVLNRSNIIKVEEGVPDGVIVDSYYARVDYTVMNYCIALIIERASLLNGNITCDGKSSSEPAKDSECQTATKPPAPPQQLRQDESAKIEKSAVVQWNSPAMTRGNGETIREYKYRVTVDDKMYQTIRYYRRDVLTTIITGLDNSRHTVSVTSVNSCGLSSEPATTTVEPRDQPTPSPACNCWMNEGGRWKVVEVVYLRDEKVKLKLLESSCSETCPVFDDSNPQKEEQENPVASCCFTVLWVEDDLKTLCSCDNRGENNTPSREVVAISSSFPISSLVFLILGILIGQCLLQRFDRRLWTKCKSMLKDKLQSDRTRGELKP